MSQHDYVVGNDDGASVRSDLNSLFAAIKSLNSHASTAPASPVQGMPWMKTVSATVQEFYIYDGAVWVLICTINPTANTVVFNDTAKPSFFAHKNGTNQTNVANNTTTTITWGTESWDTGGYFASDAWTPPAGKCRITVAVELSTITDQTAYLLAIRLAGSEVAATRTLGSGTGTISILVSALVNANGSQAITASVTTTEATNKTIAGTASRSYFCGEMI